MTRLRAYGNLRRMRYAGLDRRSSAGAGYLPTLLRWLGAGLFVAAGANHFIKPDFYRRIVPPRFPNPPLLVAVSGVCEIAGGIGLLIGPLRRWAGWGLIALLIAVFPANIYMAVSPEQIPGLHIPRPLLWLRLPLQAVGIFWVWLVSRTPSGEPRTRSRMRDRSGTTKMA